MSFAERVESWNRWFDRVPQEWRFQLIMWPLLIIGAINMALTIASGFPFGLLLLLGIVLAAAVRVPHVMSRTSEPYGDAPATGEPVRVRITAAGWVHRANLWYEGLAEFNRGWVILAVLGVAGFINMVLTISAGFPFGLLFLLALLALIAIRGPYVAGWLTPPAAAPMTDAPAAIAAEAPAAALPLAAVEPAPATVEHPAAPPPPHEMTHESGHVEPPAIMPE